MTDVDEQDQLTDIPEDYAEFTAFRDAENQPEVEKPTAGEEKTPSSVPAKKAGQTVVESETANESEQEEEEDDKEEESEKPVKGETRLHRRLRELTGEIKALKSQRANRETPDTADEEETAEVVSATEEETETADKPLVRPRLSDFDDTDTQTSWDQYEEALDVYNDAKMAKHLETALTKQAQDLEIQHARKTAQADWDKAAARFEDYNEVVRAEVKISQAMESVMRMDPETGTALAYYLGQHPEESEAIAKATLANNEGQWTTALARAGMELGLIRAKLTPPGKAAPKGPPIKNPANSPTLIKKVTTASRPPTTIRGGVAVPHTDVTNEEDAANYGPWEKQREAELKRK